MSGMTAGAILWLFGSAAAGTDSGIVTLPAASDHKGSTKASPAVDLSLRILIGQIAEVTHKKSGNELEWFKKKIFSLSLGFDGRWVQPLSKKLFVAGGALTDLYTEAGGGAGGNTTISSTSGGAGNPGESRLKAHLRWEAYGMATQRLGPMRFHAGALFGNGAGWIDLFSDDLLDPLDKTLGLTPFLGADIKIAKNRRFRVEIMTPMAYKVPPLVLLTKFDNLIRFNLGLVRSSRGFAIIGFLDQRFGLIPQEEPDEDS